MEFTIEVENVEQLGLNKTKRNYLIFAFINNEKVGYLRFEDQTNCDLSFYGGEDKVVSRIIYLAMVNVHPNHKQKGIGMELYKEFGKYYKQNFNGVPVLHLFNNSIADYMFRKSVASDDIPIEAYNEEYFYKDDMSEENNINWRNLREKLPKQFQGSAIDWDYEALYGEEVEG
ncbi:gp628 [Bacillus phage G]|uniref:Gp628 n=1 Tax=Bacillus phage G TaxID=2884420 RepID=G3MB08_9CAUD|nr:gp628 [Bacillus phage G]AEO93873.1 gp628 [Bacillus phage G]